MTDRSHLRRLAPSALVLSLIPAAAWANVPIFFVFAFTRVTFWWTVPVAIAIEAAVLWAIFDLTPRRAAIAACLINIGTALLGFVVYPLAGVALFAALAPLVTGVFGHSSLVETAAYCVAAAAIDTPLELALLLGLSKVAGYGVQIDWRRAAIFLLANLVSAAVLFAAIEIGPRVPKVSEDIRRILDTELAAEIALIDAIVADLPAHVDADGKIARDWRDGIDLATASDSILEMRAGTDTDSASFVALSFDDTGSGYSFSYGKDRRYGAAIVTRGKMIPYDSGGVGLTPGLEVIHYRRIGTCGASTCFVTAMLAWPDS